MTKEYKNHLDKPLEPGCYYLRLRDTAPGGDRTKILYFTEDKTLLDVNNNPVSVESCNKIYLKKIENPKEYLVKLEKIANNSRKTASFIKRNIGLKNSPLLPKS